MPIHILPENVASRIAAGEVVERPASVVKELVENSLDAEATRIEIETEDGGKKLIRIRDNGTGIPADEVELAFRRYATSKLETAADLSRIQTLGFRGEALASIASVSTTTCSTRHRDAEVGIRLRLEGGKVVAISPVGRPPGTEIVIEDLFYNVPARRKFLNTERTERRHIDGFITRYAIAYPETAFLLLHNGREYINTPGNGNTREVFLNVYGTDLGNAMLEIPLSLTEGSPIQVRGFVGPTNVHRANRGYITLFINGRWIQDLRITYAVIQAYRTLLPVQRYPVAFVMLDIDPEDVDVNVHPAKSEVRFRDADSVFREVQRAVRATVMEQAPEAVQWQPHGETSQPSQPQPEQATLHARLTALRPNTGADIMMGASLTGSAIPTQDRKDAFSHREYATPSGSTGRPNQLPPLRVVGQVSTMFIVAEGPDGLYLIDQHAAHERVLYERMLAQWMAGSLPSQPLLEPQVIEMPAEAVGTIEDMLPDLQKLGLDVESFGPKTFIVRALPAILTHTQPGDLLVDIASPAPDERSPIKVNREDMLIRTICKRAAIKAGQTLSREEMSQLVLDLERTDNPRTCPHGRPTIIQISIEALARQFQRG